MTTRLQRFLDSYCTLRQAAEYLGRSYEQVTRYVTAGDLPAVKIGGQRFVRRTDLVRFRPRPVGRPVSAATQQATSKRLAKNAKKIADSA